MGRNTNALVCLVASLLLLGLPSAEAVSNSSRAKPGQKVARSATPTGRSRTGSLANGARGSKVGPRLSAGAQAPRGAVPEEKAALEIPDLRSQSHAASIVEALQGVKGVKNAVVDVNTHLAVVDYDPRVTELDHFLTACKEAGFDATEYRVENRFPKPIKLKGG